ncbi:MAG: DUF4115 domain-containing protein [Anaerolineae bacterium]|nr:DUF4115 domain-containing protein [Anaerolineae bacterium]
MDELGHILREARETKGLTLQEVQAETRITVRYLDALENGDYDRLPTPVHVRGFLRNYARFLGLDPQPLLDRYEYGQGKRPKKKTETFANQQPLAPALKEPPADQPFFEPVNMEVDAGFSRRAGGPRSDTILRLVIIAALIGLIYLAGQRFIPLLTGNGDGTERLTEDIQGAVQGLLDQSTPTPEVEDIPELSPSDIITSTGRNDFVTGSGGVSTTLPTPLPTRPPLPATMETILLELLISERTWMEVTIDGEVVFSGIARPTDPKYEWQANDQATVLTGNAAGVFVTINGTELGFMGQRGEYKEEVWTTTQ